MSNYPIATSRARRNLKMRKDQKLIVGFVATLAGVAGA